MKTILCVLIALASACQPVSRAAVKSSATPLLYLEELPAQMSDTPPILFLLHGRGENERDLVNLGKELDPRFFLVSIRAPLELGPDRYAWYRYGDASEKEKQEAVKRILASIDEVLGNMGRDAREPVFIGGFSQGGAMSLYTASAEPKRFQGVLAFSPDNFRLPNSAWLPPTFVSHGTHDRIVPLDDVKSKLDALREEQPDVTFALFGAGHTITREIRTEAKSWIQAQTRHPNR